MSLIPLWRNVWNTWKFWQEIRRQRRELLNLDDRILRDIGLSRIDAEREANRPLWDVGGIEDATLRRRSSQDAFRRGEVDTLECCSCLHEDSRCKL